MKNPDLDTNSKEHLSQTTLLLSQEMAKSRMTQIGTSILLLVILGIQVYIFLSVNQIMREMMTLV